MAMELLKLRLNPQITLTDKGTGKMSEIPSESTSCDANFVCVCRIARALAKIRAYSPVLNDAVDKYVLPADDKRHITKYQLIAMCHKNGLHDIDICAFCFAHAGFRFKDDGKFRNNFEYFNSELADSEIPRVYNSQIFRFECFGDVGSVTHAYNYARMAALNPNVWFSAWTKNPEYWFKAFVKFGGKPKNLRLILSSKQLDKVDFDTFGRYNDKMQALYSINMFDQLFTVWSSEKAANVAGYEINCCCRDINGNRIKPKQKGKNGARCIGCMNCYGEIKNITVLIHGIIHD